MYNNPEESFIPFQIKNLQIADFPQGLNSKDYLGPVYWNFWNGNIPLGSLMVKKSVFTGEQFFYNDMKRKLSKAIHNYELLNNVVQEPWAIYFNTGQYDRFRAYVLKVTSYKIEQSLVNVLPVSVIICTAGRPNDLRKCLLSLSQMAYVPTEIVVVDNAPGNPDMLEVIKPYHNITFIKEPRKGLDIARNTGLHNASQAIVAYVDDDVTVQDMWLYHTCKIYDNPKVKAGVGLVLPTAIGTFAQYLFECFWSFNRGYSDFFYEPNFLNKKLMTGPPVWKIGAGANMSFRKDFLINAGGFDERLDAGAAGCNGDSESWFRILKHGGTIHYNPRAVAWHSHREEIVGLKKQLFNYMKGFTVAAFIQQKQLPKAKYYQHILWVLPKFYKQVFSERSEYFILRKFTAKAEFKGIPAGIWYYLWHRKKSQYLYPTIKPQVAKNN